MAGVLKKHLKLLYTKILAALQTIPNDAAYRKYTEQIISERFHAVKTEANVEKLEQRINCGQIEEVIQQAENELYLARKMSEWKPWEPLVEEAPENQWKWPI
ncbi:PREDICTED: NADH dehydrogenase [ubiquinone] 1 alpha subcomplex subunit 5 isoform X2 [Nanorana parkeri]|uniref:NADH dehydrogenase [ubiquinone] 1 alpha subcomplex subunit 5 isoform X2 n=1 Tax=Nanorana parkeri TaxID=125878 RepID=UPI0008546B76|nr:PREDICTED: NADH dehydrogenase [ubiquinone] 1 alpha subcomplex subunit 5 isoform X2 [Nanorana parkeri]